MVGGWCGLAPSHPSHFHCAHGFGTLVLAHMLDSLVRVSRRGKGNHFVRALAARKAALPQSWAAAGLNPLFQMQSTLPPRGTVSRGQRTRPDQALPAVPLSCEASREVQAGPTLVSFGSLSAISSTFDSLFKVLFIFPSRYLFAIGLPPIFSFRWNLPPTLSCNPKQLDSLRADRTRGAGHNGVVTLHDALFQGT